MNGKLYLAGAETSPYFGGYMDGAVYSALRAAKNIIQCINK
jgi:monoamine oxidase